MTMENLPDEGHIESVARKFQFGDEPSLVDEYARFTIDERLELFLRLRLRVIKDPYEVDPGFERVHSIAPASMTSAPSSWVAPR